MLIESEVLLLRAAIGTSATAGKLRSIAWIALEKAERNREINSVEHYRQRKILWHCDIEFLADQMSFKGLLRVMKNTGDEKIYTITQHGLDVLSELQSENSNLRLVANK